MHLRTRTVDRSRVRLVNLVHEIDETPNFSVGAVEVVIVDVQDGVRIGLSSRLEGDRDEGLGNGKEKGDNIG